MNFTSFDGEKLLIDCVMNIYYLARKTIYGKCPKCRTKSQLEVVSGNPGKEKFRCNQCYHKFGMEEL
jgi:transposase-like protein